MPPRRKQKQPEYEPDPVITVPKVADKDTKTVSPERTSPKVIPDKPDVNLPIVGDNTAKTQGFDEVWLRVANKYRPPTIVSTPKVPEYTPKTDDKSSVSTPKVTNTGKKVREHTEDTVLGWGKVFGHTDKDIKTTKNRESES
jgi:hypothetical protein